MRPEALLLLAAVAPSCHAQKEKLRLLRRQYTDDNSTSTSTNSSSSLGTPYTSPTYSSQAYHYAPTGSAAPPYTTLNNNKEPVCTGQTLNVLEAYLDWWYTRTLYNVVSTFSVSYDKNASRTAWTLAPATTPFDITSALNTETCTSTETWNTVYNESIWSSDCTPAPTPVAASTIIIQQTAYKTINATTGYGYPPSLVRTPRPAVLTVPESLATYSAGTAFVYFSKYEIMTQSLSTYGNGSVACATATNTYDMAVPFSFEYIDGDVNGTKVVGQGVVGDVDPALLPLVGAADAVAGSWVAEPTVAIVVQDVVLNQVVMAAIRPGFAPKMTTESILQTPSATLPTFNTPAPPKPTGGNHLPPPPPLPGHIESTQTKLQTPKPPPGQPTPKPPNSPAPPQPLPTNNRPVAETTPSGVKHAISIIFSGVRTPTTTNALSVLKSAESTYTHVTAAAIIHGISGPKHTTAPPQIGPVSPGQQNGVGKGPNGSPVIVVNGETITANSHTEFIIAPGKTLTPGGEVVMHGTTLSLAPSLTAVIINHHTFPAAATITPGPILFHGAAFLPNSGSTYTIDGQTLTPGGVITVQGSTISLVPGATAVVINGVTSTLTPSSLPASITSAPALTIGGRTFSAAGAGPTYVIDGKTLTPGEQETVIVDGKTYIVSLAPGATLLEVEALGPKGRVTATTWETLGASSRPAASASVAPATGAAAERLRGGAAGWSVIMLAGGLVGIVAWL